ncbi:hypothetical protein MesoLj131c_17730 [Mesorhizobium sp. 131-3-5]|uniref:hypothetical protein n=1 Tax=Mesorhizobium sp. 131-3-5 TaxID=2744520 RepID=UPI0019253677|nr:hypothetical protein [Mesorhizobium sp. 131-3-5]BCH07515.1 hypothetical protein MesoLj131c_17730 [Mesorhizobium sp. 131-3-5]
MSTVLVVHGSWFATWARQKMRDLMRVDMPNIELSARPVAAPYAFHKLLKC